MDTAIAYLDQIHTDLLDAGRKERRRRVVRWPVSGRRLIAAVSALTLVAAGTVGWWLTKDQSDERHRAVAGSAPMPSAVPERENNLFDEQAALGRVAVDLEQWNAAQPQAPSSELSRVIRTARIGLVVPRDSFDDRFAEAVDAAEANNGFVATSTTRERSGSVTLRVPAARFTDTLADLRALGEVEVQTIEGRDVTAEYVDLRARLRIAKARREVLLGLMDEAVSIEQTIRVQNALDETQLRIEDIQGQVNLLDDRTSLATIRLELREEGEDPGAGVDTPSIPNAFERAVAGFVGVIAGVVVGLGYVIPILLIGFAAWFVVARVRRRRSA